MASQRCRAAASAAPPLYSATRKKRRRRKEGDGDAASASSADDDDDDDDSVSGKVNELPDFDLGDDGNEAASGSSVSASKSKKPTSAYIDPLGEISANMMGSTDRPGAKSVKELLNDRSLERKFEFLDSVVGGAADVDDSLPDLLAPLKGKSVVVSSGPSKRERQAATRLEAQAAADKKKEEEESLLAKLPLIRDEKGEISPVKILENATWACIWALVAWEIYLNSPFFDRAAPMAPVVY